MAYGVLVDLRRKKGTFDADKTLHYIRSHWSNLDGKPSTFNPASHDSTHDTHNDGRYLRSDVFPLTLDTPITALNGNTLREVFEDGKIDLSMFYTAMDVTYLDNKMQLYYTQNDYPITYPNASYFYITNTLHYYYYNFEYGYDNSNALKFFQISSEVVSNKTGIKTGVSGTYIYFNHAVNTGQIIDYEIDYLYLIDLTALGINNLTVEQMDYWYRVYSRLKPYDERTVTEAERTTWNDKLSSVPFNHVTNSRLADVPTLTVKGRVSASTGDPQDLTMDTLKTMLAYNQDEIIDGTTYKRVTQSDKDTWSAKQSALGYTPVPVGRVFAGLDLTQDRSVSDVKEALAYIHSDVGAQAAHAKLAALAALGSGSGIVEKNAVDGFTLTARSSIGTINNITMNGVSNQNPSFYAPTTVGTEHYILGSAGSGAPAWIERCGYKSSRVSTAITPSLSLYGHKALFIFTGTGTRTITIPANSSQAFPIGTEWTIINYNTGATSFVCSSGVTINGSAIHPSYTTMYRPMRLIKVDTDAWVGEYSA